MRFLIALSLILICVRGATGQEWGQLDPKNSYSVFAAYSNDSSHMILGVSEHRRLLEAGVDYSRRLGSRSIYSWRYQIEVIPVELLQNPRLTTTVTNVAIGDPTSIDFLPGTFRFSAMQQRQCVSSGGSGTYFEDENGQEIPVGTYLLTSVCSHPWSYGAGVSPLGQKVNFLPHSRAQPFVAVNAGFVAFTETVPSDMATMFNFSFEFGGGLEWNVRPGHALSLDYRCHHISNAGRGMENPGVDSGTFRLAYSFWR
jgi:Lipid A 3-O-deacylase (PagL)